MVALVVSSARLATAQSADRGLLWHVVQLCVTNNRLTGAVFPCLDVNLSRGVEAGYAVVRAPLDKTHIVVVPTSRVVGVESAELQKPDTPSYFADAWASRRFVEQRVPHPLDRAEIGLAINSLPGRSQDQLHIHIDCLHKDVRDALRAHSAEIGQTWSRLRYNLQGERYWAMRLRSPDLAGVNVFKLVTDGIHIPEADRARMTIVVAGATFEGGEDGFYLLAAVAGHSHHNDGHGELLLDNSCTGY